MSGFRSTAACHVDQNSSAHVARSFAMIWELLLFKWSQLKFMNQNIFPCVEKQTQSVRTHFTVLSCFKNPRLRVIIFHSSPEKCYNLETICISKLRYTYSKDQMIKKMTLYTSKCVLCVTSCFVNKTENSLVQDRQDFLCLHRFDHWKNILKSFLFPYRLSIFPERFHFCIAFKSQSEQLFFMLETFGDKITLRFQSNSKEYQSNKININIVIMFFEFVMEG